MVKVAIRLPDLEQDIDINTADLAKAIAEAEAFGKAMDRALKVDTRPLQRNLNALSRDVSELGREAVQASVGVNTLADSISRLNTRIQAARTGLQNLRQDMTNLDRDSRGVANNIGKISDSMDRINTSSRAGRANLKGYADELGRISNNTATAATSLRGMGGNIDDFDDSVRRSNTSLRDYNDNLARLGQGGGAGGPRIGEDLNEQANSAGRAARELDELKDTIARLAATIAATEGAVDSFKDSLNNLGGSGNAAEIQRLNDQIDELRNELAEVSASAQVAASRVKNFGAESAQAAGGVGLLAGATGVLNAAMNTQLVGNTAKMGVIFDAIAGVIGAVGAGIGQLATGVISFGAGLAPIANLAGILPSMITGIGLLGVTIKAAFSEGDNEFGKQIEANKKRISELGSQVQTVIQENMTGAFSRLTDVLINMGPAIKTGFGQMSTVLSEITDNLTGIISDGRFQDQFSRLFTSAAEQARDYGSVATNAFRSVSTVAAAGIPIAERFSESIKDLAQKYSNMIQTASDNGSLAAALEEGYQVATRVVGIIADLGRGLRDMGRIGKDVGLDESIMASFERGAQGARNFARTYRNELKQVYENAKGLFDGLGQVISQIGRTIFLDLGKINLGPLVSEAAKLVEIVGKIALPAGDSLVKGFTGILSAVTNARGPLINIGEVLAGVIDTLGDFGAGVIPKIVGPLQRVSVEVATFVRNLASAAEDILPAVIGPLTQIVSSTQRMASDLIAAIAPIVKQLAQPFADAFSLIQDEIGKTAGSISGPLQTTIANVLPAISDAFRDVIPAVGELVVKIAELVAAFSTSFGGAITGLVSALLPIIDIFTRLAEAAAGLPEFLKTVVTGLLAFRLIAPIGGMLSGLAGHFTGLAGAIRGAYGGAGGGLAGLRAGLGSFMTFLGGPWGLVIAGAAVGLAAFGMSQQDAKQDAAEHKAKLEELKGTLDQVTGAVTNLTLKKIGKDLVDAGLVDDLKQLGSTTGEAIDALGRGGAALNDFKNKSVAAFLDIIENSQAYQTEIGKVDAKTGLASSAAGRALADFSKSGSFSMQALAQAWASGNNSYTAFAEKIASETGRSVSSVKDGFEAIREAIDSTTGGSASGLSGLGDNIANLGEASESVRTAFENMSSAAANALRGIEGYADVSDAKLLRALDSAYRRGIPVSQALAEIGITGTGAATVIASFGDGIDASSGKLTGFGDAAQVIREKLQQIADEASRGIPGAEQLADAFGIMGDQASTAADKARALQDILEIMNGSTKALEDAQFDWAESLADVRTKIVSMKEANEGFVQSINDSNGQLDKNNAQHREFRKSLGGMVEDYNMVNAAVYQNTKASEGQEAALAAVYQSATNQRQAFIDLLTEMGFVPEAAGAIADSLGLIPEQQRLGFAMDGTDQLVQTQIANIVAQLSNIPGGEVTIQNSDGSFDASLKKMEELGYTITKGAHGEVSIKDNFAGVREELNTFQQRIKEMPEGKLTIAPSEITKGSLAALEDLGYRVEKGYDGKLTITDNTIAAKDAVTELSERVANMPSGSITVDENEVTKATRTGLEELGLTVTTLPNGFVTITSNAALASAELDTIVNKVLNMPAGSINIKESELTAATRTSLETLGFTIQSLPNGTVNITSNAAITQSEVDSLRNQVAITMNGEVVIDSATTTTEALGRLEDLGYTVETLPDGRIKITDNTSETNSRIDGTKRNLSSIPSNTPISVTADTGQADGAINTTNYKVSTMPDGSLVITATASTGGAESSINYAARDRTSRITVYSSTVKAVADGDIVSAKAYAKGGIERVRHVPFPVIPMAEGGSTSMSGMLRRARKMSNAFATIVPPNSPRLIGDNLRRDELFMPIDPSSSRSISLLRQGAFRMGFELIRRNEQRAIGFASGGMATNVKNNMIQAGKYMSDALVARTSISGALQTQSRVIAQIVGDQSAQLKALFEQMRTTMADGTATATASNTNFVFNQYNPQPVPASEMVNRGLQLAAASGLIG